MRRRSLSAVLAAVLLGQTCCGDLADANVWEDRRPRAAARTAVPPPAAPEASALLARCPELSAAVARLSDHAPTGSDRGLLSTIPPAVASVRTVTQRPGPGAPLVVLVQDVHNHAEAQRNIASVLMSLSAAAPARLLVGVEGAFGPADFSPFRAGPDSRLNPEIASAFLTDGRIAASSFVGLTTAGNLPEFVGVDDAAHYKSNVAALLRAEPVAGVTAARLSAERATIAKDIAASGDRLAARLNDLRERYHAGRAGLAEFADGLAALRAQTGQRAQPLERPLQDFLAAWKIETTLDFGQVERERRAAIERLSRSAPTDRLDALASWALAYRAGRLSFGTFYGRLRALLQEQGDDLKSEPAFDRYLTYLTLSEGLDAGAVSASCRRLSREVAGAVASAELKRLLDQAEGLRLQEKLVTFALTQDDWDDLRARGEDAALSSFADFYREADARSGAMAANLAQEMEKAHPAAAVLVAGGFHTEHLRAALAARGYAVAVVQPRVTRVDGTGTEYLGLFARDRALLDQLFSGEKLFLARATTNLGFGAVGRATGEAFLAERARRLGTVRAAAPSRRAGKVQVRLLPILAASAVLAVMLGVFMGRPKSTAPAPVAPASVPSTRAPPVTPPVTTPAPAAQRDNGQLSDTQLLNLRTMREAIDTVLRVTDAKQTPAYRNAAHTLFMGAVYSQTHGRLERSESRITLFDLDAGFFLNGLLDAQVEKSVTNAGTFAGVGTRLLGEPVMASLTPALDNLAGQRSAAWAQLEKAADARQLKGDERSQWILAQRMVWLNQAATVFSVVPAAGREPVRFDAWMHTNGTAAVLAARVQLWHDPVPLIPRRGRPADLTPLVANHAERLGVDRESFLADYDLMPAEFRVFAPPSAPVVRPAAPTRPVARPAAPARPAVPVAGVPATPQEGLVQTRDALARVVRVAYADRAYEDQNGIFLYLLLTANHESGVFRWIQQMVRVEGRLVPGGPAKSYFGIETWSAMDDIPYLAARPDGRAWFVASMGERNGDAFWTAMTAYLPTIRRAYADIDTRLRAEGLTGRDLRRRTSTERTRWLHANIHNFQVDLPDDAEGPIDFDRLLVRTDVAVPFAVAKDRRYRREVVPEAGDLTTTFMRRIYPDYKARWNTPQGAATESNFVGDGERLLNLPQGRDRLPPGAMAMLWALRAGLSFFGPLTAFLPVTAVRLLIVAVFVPLVEIWAVPLPWFAGWHRNVSDGQYRYRVALQAGILLLSLGAGFLFADTARTGLLMFTAGLYVFHSLVNIVEFLRTGGNVDDFAAAEAPLARQRVAAALVRLSPGAMPVELNLTPSTVPSGGRRLLALDNLLDGAEVSDASTAASLLPAVNAVSAADEDRIRTPTEIGGAGLRLHVLNAGEDPVRAARALSRERRANRQDLILTSATGDELDFLNATAAQPGVTFVSRAQLTAEALSATAARLGLSTTALTIIVGQAASLDEGLVASLRELAVGDSEMYLKVGASSGLAAALLVQIDGFRLTEMLREQMALTQLVATQA